MSSGQRYYTPSAFEIDANGVPLKGSSLYFYLSGNPGTFLDTYQDVGLTTPNPNPVVADGNGRFGSIFLSPSQAYQVQLWTAGGIATGSQIWEYDPVGPAAGGVQTNISGIIGEVRMFAAPSGSVPEGWYLCYGQAVSRTTYSAAFAVLGTIWGAGDGSTTFNLPDFRGTAGFGVDNMGGVPAGRVTSGGSGISGVTLGASGGSQYTQSHVHNINDPGHAHTITDPGHTHTILGSDAPVTPGAAAIETNGTSPGGTFANLINRGTTGVTVNVNTTGITDSAYGQGSSQNMPPAAMVNMIIYLGA